MRSKGQISFNFNYKVNCQTLCVFSQMKDTKHAQGVGLLGGGGGGGGLPMGSKKIFFKHRHVAYPIYGDDEQNRMQVKFSS